MVPAAPAPESRRIHSGFAVTGTKGSQVRASSPLSFGARRFRVAFVCRLGVSSLEYSKPLPGARGLLLATRGHPSRFFQRGWGTMSAFLLCAGTVRLKEEKRTEKKFRRTGLLQRRILRGYGAAATYTAAFAVADAEVARRSRRRRLRDPRRGHSKLTEPVTKGSQVRVGSPLSD